MEITFEVFDKIVGDGGTVQDTATRKPQAFKGWKAVLYQGNWYKLWGGIHTSYRIYLSSPYKSKLK